MKLYKNIFTIFTIFLLLTFLGCASTPVEQESSKSNDYTNEIQILEKCKKNILIASPNTLKENFTLLSDSNAGNSETGKIYAYISFQLLKTVFPVVIGDIEEPTLTSTTYNDIFSKIKTGKMPDVKQDDINFLTTIILPVAVLFTDDKNIEKDSLVFINRAIKMNEKSVLPVYLRGFINEKNGKYSEALADFSKALELDPSCYTAELETAKIYSKTGKKDISLEIMDLLTTQYPYSIEILMTAAKLHFEVNDLKKALEYTTEILRIEPDKPEALLLRAKIFLQENNVMQAARLIDVINRNSWNNPDYFIVKSTIERLNENIEGALETLKEGISKYPNDKNIEQAYGTILMQTDRKDEARDILNKNKNSDNSNSESLVVLINDAIESKNWEKASALIENISLNDSSIELCLKVWSVWYLQNENQKALETAEILYKRFNDDFNVAIAYIKSLIAVKNIKKASNLINEELAKEENPERKSELFYLKSKTATTDQEELEALRSSLFEDLKNMDAMLSISRLYYKMGDKRKAYRYLKQALILAPDNKEIKLELQSLEEELG